MEGGGAIGQFECFRCVGLVLTTIVDRGAHTLLLLRGSRVGVISVSLDLIVMVFFA